MKNKINIESVLNGSITPDERESLKRACRIADGKDAAWDNICRKADIVVDRKSTRSIVMRRIMRVAAVLVPVLVVAAGVRYVLPAYQHDMERKAVKAVERMSDVDAASFVADTIVLRNASLQMVIEQLTAHYTQIKGVVGNVSADSVFVTTSFVRQPLDEVLEELNYHFNQKLSLDDNGNLTISD